MLDECPSVLEGPYLPLILQQLVLLPPWHRALDVPVHGRLHPLHGLTHNPLDLVQDLLPESLTLVRDVQLQLVLQAIHPLLELLRPQNPADRGC